MYYCFKGWDPFLCVRISDNLRRWRNLIHPRRFHPNDIYRLYIIFRLYIFSYIIWQKQLFLCLIKTHYCSSIQRVNSKLSNILLHVIERSHSWYHFSTKMHRFKTRTKWYTRNVGASLSSAKRHHFSPLHRIFLFAATRNVGPSLASFIALLLSEFLRLIKSPDSLWER